MIITTGELWRLSWWLYHFVLLGAMLIMLQGLVRQYATGTSLAAAVRGLFTADPVERIEAGIAPWMRALRILAVADVYDAVTSHRSYRKAWSHEQAMALIQEGAGTQFDPACADTRARVMSTSPRVERYPAWLQSLAGQPLASTPS